MNHMSISLGARVLIHCSQGCIEPKPEGGGFEFSSEFPADNAVYIRHATKSFRLVQESGYTHFVAAGSHTQAKSPDLSEGESVVQCLPRSFLAHMRRRILIDWRSLDSVENVYLSLMAVRKALGLVPISAVGVSVCWAIKQRRFELTAAALGIKPFQFHGFARNADAANPEALLKGEERQVTEMVESGDHLLLGKKWEEKRRSRYHLSAYERRLAARRREFPRFFAALDALRENPGDHAGATRVRKAFRDEVLQPRR
jgi:hypothetical protein